MFENEKKWPFIEINPLVNAAMYSSLFRFRFRLIFRVGRAHQLILGETNVMVCSLASSISEKTQLLAHFARRGQVPATFRTWHSWMLPAKLWEFHARPGCHGRANSKIRASHLKKNSIINQSMKWNEDIIKSLFPRALMHVTVLTAALPGCNQLPSRRHRWRHYITTVTAATNTIAPSRPYLSPRLRPPPPPPASRLPAPLSPARGRTPGHCQSMCGQRATQLVECGPSGWMLWWTGSMKHPRRWRAFSRFLHWDPLLDSGVICRSGGAVTVVWFDNPALCAS